MPIKKDSSRQEVIAAIKAITGTDAIVTPATGFQPVIEVPGGAELLNVSLVVTVAFGAAITADVGDEDLNTRYATALDMNTLGKKTVTMTGLQYTAVKNLGLKFSAAPAATGRARLSAEYVINGRAAFSQGLD